MTEWISVKDRLPYDGEYLVLTENLNMYVARYYYRLPTGNPDQTNWNICCDCKRSSTGHCWPTHWMPLPLMPVD